MHIGQMHLGDKSRDALGQLNQDATDPVWLDHQLLDGSGDDFADGDIFDAEERLIEDLLLKRQEEQPIQGIVADNPSGVNRSCLVRTAVFEKRINLAILDAGDMNKSGHSFNSHVNVESDTRVDLNDCASLDQGRAGENLQREHLLIRFRCGLGRHGHDVGDDRDSDLGLIGSGKVTYNSRLEPRARLVFCFEINLLRACP